MNRVNDGRPETGPSYTAVCETPMGIHLGIQVQDGMLVGLDFLSTRTALHAGRDELTREVVSQLQRYYADPTWKFDLPIRLQGTEYQQRVWRLMRNIRAGNTESYGGLAKKLSSSARAVGGACRANPVPIIVPCHRVVASHGIGGFAGDGSGGRVALKHWLLQHEGVMGLK